MNPVFLMRLAVCLSIDHYPALENNGRQQQAVSHEYGSDPQYNPSSRKKRKKRKREPEVSFFYLVFFC